MFCFWQGAEPIQTLEAWMEAERIEARLNLEKSETYSTEKMWGKPVESEPSRHGGSQGAEPLEIPAILRVGRLVD